MGAGPIRLPETLIPTPARNDAKSVHSQTAPGPEAKQPAPPVTASEEINTHWDADNGVVVEITDKQSGELVRQIPSQQVLNVAHYIEQYLLQNRSPSDDQENVDSEPL